MAVSSVVKLVISRASVLKVVVVADHVEVAGVVEVEGDAEEEAVKRQEITGARILQIQDSITCLFRLLLMFVK